MITKAKILTFFFFTNYIPTFCLIFHSACLRICKNYAKKQLLMQNTAFCIKKVFYLAFCIKLQTSTILHPKSSSLRRLVAPLTRYERTLSTANGVEPEYMRRIWDKTRQKKKFFRLTV